MPAQGFEELPVPCNAENLASGAVVEAMGGAVEHAVPYSSDPPEFRTVYHGGRGGIERSGGGYGWAVLSLGAI
jgi:hypothetical protein